MPAIPGVVPVFGVVGPADQSDEYAVSDPVYGRGGWREVVDAEERDNIPVPRRRAGMVVVTQDDMAAWQLQADLTTWLPFDTGGVSGTVTDFSAAFDAASA